MATLEQVIDTIIAEAVGEGPDGMAAVAWTMKNRADERGKAITDVVNGRAYSGLSNPGAAAKRAQRDPSIRAQVSNILTAVQTGAYPDPTGGATHYWAPKGMPGGKDPYWADEEAGPLGQHRIGNHVYLPKRAPAPVPPGEIPSVATITDTIAPAVSPTPATLSNRGALVRGVTSPTGGNNELQAYVNAEAAKRAAALTAPAPARLPNLPPSRRDRPVPQSIIERAPTKPAVSQGLLEALGSGSASARLNGTIAPPASARETNLAFDPGAVADRVNTIPQDTALAAMLARRVAPPAITTQSARQAADTRTLRAANQANTNAERGRTVVASIPTGPVRTPAPSRVPVPQSIIERGPPRQTIIPTAPVIRQNTNIATARAEQASQRTPSLAAAPKAIATQPRSAITPVSTRIAADTQMFRNANQASLTAPARLPALAPSALGQPPATRVVQSVPVAPKPVAISASDRARGNPAQTRNVVTTVARIPTLPTSAQIAAATPFRQSIPARLPQGQAGIPAAYGAGGVAGVGSKAVAPLPQSRTGVVMQRPVQIADAPISVALPRPRPDVAVATRLDVVAQNPTLPNKQQLEQATGFRTVTQEKRVTNPAWTAYRAANPAQATAIGSAVPLGEMTYKGSRDSKAAALAGQNFAANKMPEQFITVKKQVRVPVAAPAPAFAPAPFAAPRLGAVAPRIGAAPVPVMPFAPAAANPNPIMSLIGAIVGQRQPGDLLSSIIGARAPRPPVGAVLGVAGNGGQMVQGHNGLKNSITQNSDAWKRATGQSSYGSGQSNDTSYGGYQF